MSSVVALGRRRVYCPGGAYTMSSVVALGRRLVHCPGGAYEGTDGGIRTCALILDWWRCAGCPWPDEKKVAGWGGPPPIDHLIEVQPVRQGDKEWGNRGGGGGRGNGGPPLLRRWTKVLIGGGASCQNHDKKRRAGRGGSYEVVWRRSLKIFGQ